MLAKCEESNLGRLRVWVDKGEVVLGGFSSVSIGGIVIGIVIGIGGLLSRVRVPAVFSSTAGERKRQSTRGQGRERALIAYQYVLIPQNEANCEKFGFVPQQPYRARLSKQPTVSLLYSPACWIHEARRTTSVHPCPLHRGDTSTISTVIIFDCSDISR